MKTGRRLTALWLAPLLALIMVAVWQGRYLASAQSATPTPAPAATPKPAATPGPATTPAPAAAMPNTLQEVDAQIAQVEAQIKQLNDQADKLITASEQEQKKRLRDQIKTLKQQLRILKRRQDQLANATSIQGMREIQDRYRARIQQLENESAQRRHETIARYEAILARDPNSRIAPDVLWRLAYLYFEEAHTAYLNAWDTYESAADQLYRRGNTEAAVQEPKHNYSRTIAILDRLLNQFPNYEKKDDVLYLLAYCLQEMDDNDRALTVYQRIIAETPTSPMVPEALVREGEIYFDRDQFPQAIELYKKVLQFRSSNFYDKALYKLGWSYYKLNNYEQAVKYFTDVLAFYRDHPVRRGGHASEDLRQDAVDYIAISFTESEGSEGARAAIAFLQNFGDRDIARQILSKIGDVYDEQTNYDAARQAYHAYIANFPTAPDLPDVYRRIAVTYEKQQMYEEAVQTYMQIAQQLGPNSAWAQANAGRTTELQEAAGQRQSSMFAAGTYYHEKAQHAAGAEQQAFYKKAIEVYSMFLQNYPDADGAYETAYNLAECYMETKQYELAAQMYQKVIGMKRDKQMWTEALFNNAKAYELMVDEQGGLPNHAALEERTQIEHQGVDTTGQRKTVTIQPVQISAVAKKWVDALLLHVQDLPQAERSPVMLYKVGEIFYLHGDFDNARKYFEQLFQQYPSNPVVQYAAHYYLETYKQREEWTEYRLALGRLPTSGGRLDSRQFEAVRTGVTFKIAEQLLREATSTTPVDKNKVQLAINEYLSAVQRNPNDPNAGLALYNVAVAYESHLGDVMRANDMFVRMAQSYPKNKYAADALWHAAYNYQVLIEFDKAIDAYRTFARLFPSDKNGGNALLNAGALLEESGRLSEALPPYQDFLNRFSAAAEAPEIAFSVASIYERLGAPDSASGAYEAYARRGADDAGRMIEAYCRWGRIMENRGNWPEAEKRYLQAKAIYQRVRGTTAEFDSQYAAESAFRIAMHGFDAYKRVSYTGNSKKDALVFKQKGELAKTLKAQFEEIITFNNYLWATAALFMVGETLNEFAESALNAPPPRDLPPDKQDEYVFKLEEAVYPFKNAAMEWFKRCLNKGVEQRLMNEWVIKSYVAILKVEADAVEPKFEAVSATNAPVMTIPALQPYQAPPAPPPPAVAPAPAVAPTPAVTPPGGGTFWRTFFGWGVDQ